jgi:NitT/TauT family transport system substrate-binding protein
MRKGGFSGRPPHQVGESPSEQARLSTISRRQFLVRSAAAGAAFAASGSVLAACSGGESEETEAEAPAQATIRWISPAGTLEVMNDYNLWVPIELGYFADLGIQAELSADGETPNATVEFVADNKADVGYPAPGLLAQSIDGGLPIRSVWGQYPAQLFDFSLPRDSPIQRVEQLAGKRIAVGSKSWKELIDPLLMEAGVDPASVTLIEAGAQWSQIVSEGVVDAGLAWEGLRAQLQGQGFRLEFLLGSEFSKGPSNVYAVRSADLGDEGRRDAYTRFLQGVVMGLEFAKANPRAAAQITYRRFPELAGALSPQIALESMLQLASGYGAGVRAGKGWGFHDPEAWEAYLATIFELGQTKKQLTPDDVLTNELVEAANAGANVERARSDAGAFELDEDFGATTVPEGIEL